MRNLVLSACIVVIGLLLTAFCAIADVPTMIAAVTRTVIVNAKVLSLVGCLLAFSQFSKGDYLRKAWGLLVVASLCLFEVQLVREFLQNVVPDSVSDTLRIVGVLGSNICTPLAMLFFARALSAAGLDVAGDPKVRFTVTVVVGVLAAGLAGRSSLVDLSALLNGSMVAADALVSDVGDMVTMVMLAPIVYNVLTLRGGALSWPFMLLALSTSSWLVYDGVGALTDWFGLFVNLSVPFRNGAWLAALLFQGAAGLTHYWMISGRLSSGPARKPA
jgi:hypothetical protein